MGALDKISEIVEVNLNLIRNCFEEVVKVLGAKEMELNRIEESVTRSSNALDFIRESVERRVKQAEEKEEEFRMFQEKGLEHLELKRNEVGLILEDVKVRQEMMNEQEKLIEGLFHNMELEEKQFESMKIYIDEKFEEICLKERHLEDRSSELDLLKSQIERKEIELDRKEKNLERRRKETELREKILASRKVELEAKENELELWERILDLKTEEGNESVKPVDCGKGESGLPRVDAAKPKESGDLRSRSRKRGDMETDKDVIHLNDRKSVAELVSGINFLEGSSQKMQSFSPNRAVHVTDHFRISSKRLRRSKSCDCCNEEERELKLCNSTGSPAVMDKVKVKMEYEVCASAEGSFPRTDAVIDDQDDGVECAIACDSRTIGDNDYSETNSDSDYYYPSPEFNDFDKDRGENCFAEGQLWACYDKNELLPRAYAEIRKVHSPGFKVFVTWLHIDPEYKGESHMIGKDFPVACGRFQRANSEYLNDRLSFSHKIHCERGTTVGSYMIYPRKGEIWALFKEWYTRRISESVNHKQHKYEIVEVVSDFLESAGIEVSYLDKIRGHLSLFQPRIGGNLVLIPPCELFRFSHQIPCFQMTGAERDGIPGGSFELDPASLPANLLGTSYLTK